MSEGLITVLTDFGTRDGYVAAMKGAILSRFALARIVDVTHEVPPGAISVAAYVLRQAAPTFPSGTVHLVVVDPGVGSERRAVACEIGAHLYVAPDNGGLGAVLEFAPLRRAHVLTRGKLWHAEVSPVFHGRDVFGPVAAHLAAGGPLEEVGDAIDAESLLRTPWPAPRTEGSDWVGSVIYVDRFGNLVTNLALDADTILAGSALVEKTEVPAARTYSDVAEGKLLALRGSSGLLEIARNRGSAAEGLGVNLGTVVTFRTNRRS